MNKVEYIEHTADIGIKVYANNLSALFVYAAKGMFSIIYEELDTLQQITSPEKSVKIETTGGDYETLLISWLNELLYYSSVEKVLFYKFNILYLTTPAANEGNFSLSAEAFGKKLSSLGIKPHIEIKAATYHKLKITHTTEGIHCAEIYFDV